MAQARALSEAISKVDEELLESALNQAPGVTEPALSGRRDPTKGGFHERMVGQRGRERQRERQRERRREGKREGEGERGIGGGQGRAGEARGGREGQAYIQQCENLW